MLKSQIYGDVNAAFSRIPPSNFSAERLRFPREEGTSNEEVVLRNGPYIGIWVRR